MREIDHTSLAVQDRVVPGSKLTQSGLDGSGAGSRSRDGSDHAALESELLRRYSETREPAVKEELVKRLLPLARSLALRYRGAPEELDDLVQVASLGLIKAIEGFDPKRGKRFAAYAAPTILGELRRHFRDRVWDLRLPRRLQERTMIIQAAIRKLGDELGRSPSVSQIAQYLELSDEEVSEALQADEARRTVSLDVPRDREDGESTSMVETLEARESGYDAVEAQLAGDSVALDDRERQVLQLRFEQDLTQYQIGDLLGISQMQVSRIMRRALHKLLDAVRGS